MSRSSDSTNVVVSNGFRSKFKLLKVFAVKVVFIIAFPKNYLKKLFEEQQPYHVVLMWLGLLGSDLVYGDGQARPCMGYFIKNS